MESLLIDLETFDFDYWNNSKIAVLNALRKHGKVDNVNMLSMITRLTYSYTWDIVIELQHRKIIVRNGRAIMLNPEWKKILLGEK